MFYLRREKYIGYFILMIIAMGVVFPALLQASAKDLSDLFQINLVIHPGGGSEKSFDLDKGEKNTIETKAGPGQAVKYSFTESGTLIEAQVISLPEKSAWVLSFTLPQGLDQAATGKYELPALAFSLKPTREYPRAFSYKMSPFGPPSDKVEVTAGPVVLYDDQLNTVVVSPLDNFLVGITSPVSRDKSLLCGIEGEVESLPAGFSHQVLIVERDKGVVQTILDWGDILREWYDKKRPDAYADVPLSYLGYWTDNGSYYYYTHAKGLNEEETLLAVKKDAEQRDIPLRYVQIDSWWYPKARYLSVFGGSLVWEPIPEKFPHGVDGLQERLGWPLVAHNRWYDKKSPYRDQYQCVDGKGMKSPTLPIERGFWDMIMDHAKAWGVAVYEQDWLDTQYDGIPWLRNGVDHAEKWITDMTSAAAERDLTMQFCMASPGFFLENVKLKPVTTVRCSDDYLAGRGKEYYWPWFHKVSILAYATGLWPFMDTFLSSEGQRTVRDEKYAEQETLISILSACMVGPGDKIGAADRELLMRTCRKDGLLLKPDRPALPIEAMFHNSDLPWTVETVSKTFVGSFDCKELLAKQETWHYVTIFNIWPQKFKDYSLNLTDLGVQGKSIIYDWKAQKIMDNREAIELPKQMSKNEYRHYIIAPVLRTKMAVIGEIDKFITLAEKRFGLIIVINDDLIFSIEGVPGEQVNIAVYSEDGPRAIFQDASYICNPEKFSGKEVPFTYNASDKIIHMVLTIESDGKATVLIKKNG